MITWRNGISPISSRPEKIIRFSQRRMISRAVVFNVARVPGPKLGRLLRPAEDRERPQRRREPGVEHVLAPGQLGRSAFGARRRRRSPQPSRDRPGSPTPGSDDPTRSGARCTSRAMFSSESMAKRCCDSGWYWTRRDRSASSAGCMSSSIEHHHWSEISGSIRSCSARRARPCGGRPPVSRAGRAP